MLILVKSGLPSKELLHKTFRKVLYPERTTHSMDPNLRDATFPYCLPIAEQAAVKSGNLATNGMPPMIGHDFGPGARFPLSIENKKELPQN